MRSETMAKQKAEIDRQSYLSEYVRYGLRNDVERAAVALGNYIAQGGSEDTAHAAITAAYDNQLSAPKSRPARAHTPARRAIDAALSWIAFGLVVAVIGTLSAMAWLNYHQPADSATQPAEQGAAPMPNIVITAQPQPAQRPQQPQPIALPQTATYDQTLPDSALGSWAPGQYDGLAVGGRKYRQLDNGSLELDDGTRVWLATTQPALVADPVTPAEQPAIVAAPPAAAVQPTPEARPDIPTLAQDQVERIAIVGAAALDPKRPAEAMQHASDAVTVGKVLVKAFGQVLNIPGAINAQPTPGVQP
jgi:hypothetical protein